MWSFFMNNAMQCSTMHFYTWMTAVGTDDILKLEVTLTDDLSSVYEYMVVCTCINSVVGVIFWEIMNEICSKFNEKWFHYACNKCLKLEILLAFFFSFRQDICRARNKCDTLGEYRILSQIKNRNIPSLNPCSSVLKCLFITSNRVSQTPAHFSLSE